MLVCGALKTKTTKVQYPNRYFTKQIIFSSSFKIDPVVTWQCKTRGVRNTTASTVPPRPRTTANPTPAGRAGGGAPQTSPTFPPRDVRDDLDVTPADPEQSAAPNSQSATGLTIEFKADTAPFKSFNRAS